MSTTRDGQEIDNKSQDAKTTWNMPLDAAGAYHS